jgi:predicted nucleotidyltransferase
MTTALNSVLDILRAHEHDLRRMGVSHAAVFGSVARGQAGPASDIDVLVDLDEARPIGIFQYARLKLYLNELLGGAGDIVNRKTIKPLLRDSILCDAINVF